MTIYSVKSDGNNAVLSGTARHGLVRLWDKRFSRPVQVGFSIQNASFFSCLYLTISCARLTSLKSLCAVLVFQAHNL